MSRKSSSSQKSADATDGSLVPFHYIQQVNNNGSSVLTMYPASFPRVLVEADAWAHFRVRALKFRLLPSANEDAGGTFVVGCVGFAGGLEDTPPATLAAISELIPSVCLPGHQNNPTNWIVVSKKELAGPFPWYKTIQGTADTTEEAPGQMCIYSAINTAAKWYIEYKGVFEFKTSMAAGSTPLYLEFLKKVREDRIRKRDVDERSKLLKVLGSPAGVPKTTP